MDAPPGSDDAAQDTAPQTATPARNGLGVAALATLCSVLVPGTGHLVARRPLGRTAKVATALNAVAMVVLAAVLAPVRSRSDLAEIVSRRSVFVSVALALAVLAVTRLVTAAEVAWVTRPSGSPAVRVGAAALCVAVVVMGVAPLGVAADYVWETDRAVEKVFSDDDAVVAVPGTLAISTTVAQSTTTDEASTSSTSSTSTSSTIPPAPGTDRVNVLLLGGDAGPGRWSLRTDSMVVVSIHPDTGDTAMISVPRNLYKLPFPPGTALAEKFSKGFPDLANAVYPYVNARPELVGGVDDAGAQAIKMGIAQFLGIPINYYVLVDMAGFVDVVDALGGIDITVNKRVPTPGNPRGSKHPVPEYIEVGPQHMDGTLALAYARSREADSDYTRMARQRCVLTGIADAATPKALATGLGALISAFGEAVRTDIPRSELGELTDLVSAFQSAGGLETARTLQFTPPVIEPARWDAVYVRLKVIEVITPPVFGGVWTGPVLANACD